MANQYECFKVIYEHARQKEAGDTQAFNSHWIGTVDEQYSCLYQSLESNNFELFKYLVNEVELSHMVTENWTTQRLESTMICPVNKMGNGSTLQHKAAYHGHDLMLYFIQEVGANMNARDEAGNAPLHVATV